MLKKKFMSDEKVETLYAKNVDLPKLTKDVEDLKSTVAHLYIPKHLETMMRKVGSIEQNVLKAHESMVTCYYVTFFIVILFVICTFAAVFILWRMNYFKFLLRHNKFGRYTRPRSCYSCWRPWKKNYTTQAESQMKASFSSPELMTECKTPRPPIMRENEMSSDSEYE
jgi:hypothetical protein